MSYYYYCRCCLEEKPNVYKIYQEIAEKLMSIANIYVSIDDGLPDIICDSCSIQVNQSYEFRQKCEYSDTLLRKWVNHNYNRQQNHHHQHHQQQQQQHQHQHNIEYNNCNVKNLDEPEYVPIEQIIKIEKDNDDDDDSSFSKENLIENKKKIIRQENTEIEKIVIKEELNIEEDNENDVQYENIIDQLQNGNTTRILGEEEEEENEEEKKTEDTEKNFIHNDDSVDIVQQATSFEQTMVVEDDEENSYNNNNDDDDDAESDDDQESEEKSIKQISKEKKRSRYIGKERCCRMCDRTFTSCKALRSHQYTHLKNGEFICNYCGKKYKKSQLNVFRRHLRYHVIEKRLVKQQQLQQEQQNDEENSKDGEQDSQEDNKQLLLQQEQQQQEQQKQLQLQQQQKQQQLQQKQKQRQQQQQKQEKLKNFNSNIYKCDICDKYFSHLATLRKHKKSHLKRTCPYCFKQYSYATTEGYREHIKRHISDGKDGVHHCNECNKIFATASYLRNHMITHLPNRPKFQCSQCFKLYNSKHALDEHFNIHLGIKRPTIINCQYCGKGYSRLSELRIHLRFHTGERPYSCSYCDKTFQTSSSLIVHKRQHTGERPYKCLICNKTFIRSDGIKNHMYIHSGERQFPCKVCGKRFIQPHTRNAHQRKHFRNHHKRINIKKEEV